MSDNHIPYSAWLHLHDEDMRRDYADRPNADMAGEHGVDYYTVSRRATRLGLSKSEAFMHASWKKGAKPWKVKGEAKQTLMKAHDEYMRAHFATTKNDELARLFGVDVKTVRRWARRLGLQKSEAFMQAARGRGHAKIRQGYYTPEHEAWREQRIREVYPDGDEQALQQLAQELGVTRKGIGQLAIRYGVRRSKERVSEAMREGSRRNGRTKYDAAFIAALRDYYPDHTNRECADHFGISAPILAAVAHNHGICKSKEHLKQFKTWATRNLKQK